MKVHFSSSRVISGIRALLGALFLAVFASACIGPAKVEPIVEIGPSETAFVLSLEQNAEDQATLPSKEYLLKKKVATKRYTIPLRQRNKGRMPGDYEWLPTQMVVLVDRAPISRQWEGNHSIKVQSKDSMGFDLNINTSMEILEDHAHGYLYYFGATAVDNDPEEYKVHARPLGEVADEVVHHYIQTQASDRFGRLSINEASAQQNAIVDAILTDAKTFFLERGITLTSMGWVGGIHFVNPEIQKAIDGVYVAQNDIIIARNEQVAELTEAETLIQKAQARRDAAIKLYAGREAALFATGLNIRRINAQTRLTAAKQWDGIPPSIAPAGAMISFGLDRPQTSSTLSIDFGGWPTAEELTARLKPKLEEEERALAAARKIREDAAKKAAEAAPPTGTDLPITP